MHPALSVVLFTTTSGAGYGLLFLLGVFGAFGLVPPDPWLGGVGLALALVLVTAGLLSSTVHLGHPERAWRALSQWRSSWLSREGVASLATYPPALLYALGWVVLGRTDGFWAAMGLLAALGALATLVCTGMIYASLKPIRRWSNPWTLRLYLGAALATGALWLHLLARAFGLADPMFPVLALVAVGLGWAVLMGYWQFVDTAPGVATAETATGLGRFGKVRLLEAPHTSENYLLKEMGFQIARKHAARLRRIALAAGFAAPGLLTLLAWAAGGAFGAVLAGLAAVSAMVGMLASRWLFFAEAKHTVTLYYGQASA